MNFIRKDLVTTDVFQFTIEIMRLPMYNRYQLSRLLLCFLFFACASPKTDKKSQTAPSTHYNSIYHNGSPTFRIRWTMAHLPEKYFVETAKYFKRIVEKQTDKDIVVEILSDNAKLRGKSRSQQRRIARTMVENGAIEMTQMYTYLFAKDFPEFYLLDLPFMFASKEHVEQFVEGSLGESLMSKASRGKVSALALTFSGGFQTIVTQNVRLEKVEDFKNLRYWAFPDPIGEEWRKQLGMISGHRRADGQFLNFDPLFENNEINAAECTYADADFVFSKLSRSKANILNETHHRVLFSVVVINNDFLKKLPKKYRRIVSFAAKEAGRFERNLIYKDSKKIKERIGESAIEIIKMPPNEEQNLFEKAEPIFKKYKPIIGERLILETNRLRSDSYKKRQILQWISKE